MSIASCSAFTFPTDISASADFSEYELNKKESIIVKKEIDFDSKSYVIYNNNPLLIDMDIMPHRMFRSVITDSDINEENSKILSVAPPNTLSLEKFKELYPIEQHSMSNIYANEMIEGTLVNLYYDQRYSKWEISTRSSIGANHWYFRTQYQHIPTLENKKQTLQLTFRQMFIQALLCEKHAQHVSKSVQDESNAPELDINDIELFNKFDKTCCYHFVFQHPHNHFVFLNTMQVYLVGVHHIKDKTIRYIPAYEYETWTMFQNSNILFPSKIEIVFDAYGQIDFESTSFPYSMGTMYTHVLTGDRMFYIRNDYAEWRLIRGNNPNLQYHFYQLLTNKYLFPNNYISSMECFLELFPHYYELFTHFNLHYLSFINRIYNLYVSYYILKNQENLIQKQDFIHIGNIHRKIYIYYKSIGQHIKITKEVIMDYFEKMTPSQLMYFVNHTSCNTNKVEKEEYEEESEPFIMNDETIVSEPLTV